MATVAEPTAIMDEISIHPPKRLLYGPGPGQVHPRVYQAMAQPIVGHLDAYFFRSLRPTFSGCCACVFGTTNEMTFVISATGSGGMETAISNFVEPGTKVASSPTASSAIAWPRWRAGKAATSFASKSPGAKSSAIRKPPTSFTARSRRS